MALDTSVIGKPTGAHRVTIERGPVSNFASDDAARVTGQVLCGDGGSTCPPS